GPARFVLSAALPLPGLATEHVRPVVDGAFRWLARHARTDGAGYVLEPLLARSDLTEDETRRAVEAAFAWLASRAPGGVDAAQDRDGRAHHGSQARRPGPRRFTGRRTVSLSNISNKSNIRHF